MNALTLLFLTAGSLLLILLVLTYLDRLYSLAVAITFALPFILISILYLGVLS